MRSSLYRISGALAALLLTAPAVVGAQPAICSGQGCTFAQATAQAGNFPSVADGGGGASSALAISDNPGPGQFSYNRGQVDVASGSIRVNADTNYSGGASGQMFEHFWFALPDGVDAVDIAVSWTVEGLTDYRDDQPFGSASGNGAGFWISGYGGTDSVAFDALNYTFGTPDHLAFIAEGSYRRTFTDVLTVQANQLFRLDTLLQVTVVGNGRRDFGNTSYFTFEIPDGVTLTSSSGLLLTQPLEPGIVPEPAAWALMILGFMAAGVALRRGRAIAPA